MKTLRQILTSLLVAGIFTTMGFAQVETYSTDPALPILGQSVTISVNVNYWGITDKDTVTAYTGTVTTASDSKTGWRNVKNSDWNDISIPMTMVNDSVYSLTIADINAFYNVPATEEVVRITFIARGTKNKGVSGQTDDLFIDVFAQEPSTIFSYQPTANATDKDMIVVTWNINDTDTPSRNDLQGYTDTAYVHTWGNGTLGSITGPGWGENDAKWMCDAVNDSIRRFYYAPSVRGLLDMPANATVESLGILIRNKAADGQTNDFTVDFASEVDIDLTTVESVTIVPEYPTQDEPVYVYFNMNNVDIKESQVAAGPWNLDSPLSVWSGLITSASSQKAEWMHQVNGAWAGLGDSVLLDKVNDSIFVWSVPSIADKYNIDFAEESAFRLAMLVRDTLNGNINNLTYDYLFEIYGELPTDTSHTIQSVGTLTENSGFVVTVNPEEAIPGDGNPIFDLIDTNMAAIDTLGVYVWSGVTAAAYRDDIKDWQYGLASDWAGDMPPVAECIVVNSNIVRYFVLPDARDQYDVADSLSVLGVNFLLRTGDGNAKSADIYVPFDTTGIMLPLKPEASAINVTKLEGVSAYPNPTAGNITISFDEATSAKVTVSGITGQTYIVRNIDAMTSLDLDLNDLNSGLYFIVIESEQGNAIMKVLKN